MTTAAHPRLDNLLAALTLNLAEDTTAAMERSGGLTGRAIQALLALEEFLGGCHVGKLAEVLDLTHSGAVRLVSQLEDAGYAERRPGADRRRVEVVLTASGRRQAARARRAQLAVIRQATEGLDAAEAATLERLLARHNRGSGTKPVLEINMRHVLVKALARAKTEERETDIADISSLLLEEAQILDGEVPEDAAAFTTRLNRLIMRGLVA